MTVESDAKFEEKLALGFKIDITVASLKTCTLTLKRDPNSQEKLTFCLKNDMRNLMNFNSSSGKSENLHFDGIFSSKVCNI